MGEIVEHAPKRASVAKAESVNCSAFPNAMENNVVSMDAMEAAESVLVDSFALNKGSAKPSASRIARGKTAAQTVAVEAAASVLRTNSAI